MSKKVTPKMPEVGYVDMLDHALTEKENESTFEYNPLRPSSAGKCSFALFCDLQEFNGTKVIEDREPKPPNVVRLLSLGHHIEYAMIQNLRALTEKFNYILKYKQQVVTVFTLKDGTIIQGSTDFCLENKESGHKCVADAKSMKDAFHVFHKTRYDDFLEKYSSMKSLVKLSPTCFYAEDLEKLLIEFKDDFKIDNLLQLNLYACSDFFVERGYDHASLLYYNKNDSRMFEIRFKPSIAIRDMIKAKYQEIYDAKSGAEVVRDYRLGSIRCAFCDYNVICHSNDNPLVEWFNTFPKSSKKKFATSIDKVKSSKKIKTLFNKYLKLADKSKEAGDVEASICDMLSEQKISKIKLDKTHVYEVRLLKSPKPHMVLRRSK